MAKGKLQAVGKILSDRPARAEYVKKTLGAIWSPFSGVECKDMSRNRFLFSFYDEATERKAVHNGPWDFNGNLIVMESFKPNKTIDEYEFKTIPIWVRAYGIPMGMMDLDTGKLIGDQIGEFLDADLDEDGSAMGEYLRIKIRMDITVPLMRCTTLEIEEDEEEYSHMNAEGGKEADEKIITLKYEHLPDFCYSCGIIGHTERLCPTKEVIAGRRQFGPWLRVIIIKGSPREEKSRSSSEKGNFWLTNSAGSKGSKQGSDGPTWKKETLNVGNEGKSEDGEDKEVTSPRKNVSKNLPKLEGSMMINIEGAPHAEESSKFKTKESPEAEIQKEKKGRENIHRTEVESPMKTNGKRSQNTFKRVGRAKNQTHQKQECGKQKELKKRNADQMEIDDGLDIMKKARMEIDEKLSAHYGGRWRE
ncbi:hypothetical protein ACQ4PT_047568 [Festuca glaucescens]